MSAYFVFNYSITDAEGYSSYPGAAMPSIGESGAEVLVADYATDPVEGEPGTVTVVLKFESKDAARAWYDSPSYQSALPTRRANSTGIAVVCDGLGA
ncbi:MAG: DUF1330 domain-containing protein [Frankiaceae bacterium]|nr:DUF1330 domain-containing protein [Frankiaceae bacterium]MBV9872701.1 DUF1330 domain-containing protein [Frankiaceae bacterium]